MFTNVKLRMQSGSLSVNNSTYSFVLPVQYHLHLSMYLCVYRAKQQKSREEIIRVGYNEEKLEE
jgi:hypothetical protein